MLSFLAITEAVKGLVEERYPGNTVYMERVPVDFARPSFLVELGPVEMLDASCGCLEVKATYRSSSRWTDSRWRTGSST